MAHPPSDPGRSLAGYADSHRPKINSQNRQQPPGRQPIYTAARADQALVELERFDAEWGPRYPATVQAWRDTWEHPHPPLLALPEELRKAGYTTNTIEGLRRQIRMAMRATGGAHGAAARPRASNIRRRTLEGG